ncbi:1,4-alpha-glucan branching protein GlgB [Streptomyces sp. NPDC058572]|uniref:1,4-alpha-glucan branching protein GlgB n=1 Tax=Streptomyces sp. NPDC058572 TaxID=3346546 RepID=UPI00364A9670
MGPRQLCAARSAPEPGRSHLHHPTPDEDFAVTVTDTMTPALGELDLHLIAEGRHEQLWRVMGAHPRSTGTSFAVWAPGAHAVRVIGDFNDWDARAHSMRRRGSSGVWELFVPEAGEGDLYKYEIRGVDGRLRQKADPFAFSAECPPGTASRICASRHRWTDAEWMAGRDSLPHHQAPMSIYEVHLGSWRQGLSYRQLADVLPAYVKGLGFTHVELLPVTEHPFGGSWGYQVTSYYAPTARLGTPDDFRHLVDAFHRAGIGVIVDWVPAHFPKDDWALARFDGFPLYEHPDPLQGIHPDWGTLVFDYGRPEVRNFLVANAVYWCEEFHVDGLRVDAVASMLYLDYSRDDGQWRPNAHGGRENLDAIAFLQELNATVYRRCPGVFTIAEESTAWDGVTRPTDSGGLGFGMKWNMGWMHDSLGYMRQDPVHRPHHHSKMTFPMVYAHSENYILPISHDEVVHGKGSLLGKMCGDRWRQLADLRAYLAFMWAHPGKQLLFMGQEFAQHGEWWHDGSLHWELLDEASPGGAGHRGVRDLVRDLNRLYRETAALWQRDSAPEGFGWIDADAAGENLLSFVRYDACGDPFVCVYNFSPVAGRTVRLAFPRPGGWREVLNTDALCYGGSGVGNLGGVRAESRPWQGFPASASVVLPPLGALWLRPEES